MGTRARVILSLRYLVAHLPILMVMATSSGIAEAQGIFLPSVGPVNQSMGGAATACPIDSAGAINWNPATISGLKCSEISFGLGLVIPEATRSR